MTNKHPNASSPTDKLIGQSVKIAKKIAIQIIRFRKMTSKELIAHFNGNRFSSFCCLKTHNAEFFYGLEGSKLFLKLGEILVSYRPELKGKVDIDKVVIAVKKSYAHQFIIDGRQIDYITMKSMLDIAIAELNLAFKKYTHYIPCIIFTHPSPDDFTLGPVVPPTGDRKFTKLLRSTEFTLGQSTPLVHVIKRQEKHTGFDYSNLLSIPENS